jgi:hypothetical protein
MFNARSDNYANMYWAVTQTRHDLYNPVASENYQTVKSHNENQLVLSVFN